MKSFTCIILVLTLFSCSSENTTKRKHSVIFSSGQGLNKEFDLNEKFDRLEFKNNEDSASHVRYSFHENNLVSEIRKSNEDWLEVLKYDTLGLLVLKKKTVAGKTIHKAIYENGVLKGFYSMTILDEYSSDKTSFKFQHFGPTLDTSFLVSTNVNFLDAHNREELIHKFKVEPGSNQFDTFVLSHEEASILKERDVKIIYSLSMANADGTISHSPSEMKLTRE